METVKAKIKGTNAILEGCVCDDSFFVSVDHDIFERYSLCEVEICKDSLQVPETCKENTDSFTSLEEAANDSWVLYEYRDTPQGLYSSCYRDGFIAGAKWQANQLLKGSPLPEDTVLFHKGVEEGKRLMMEDAVEGWIVKDITNNLAVTAKNINLDGFKFGDKVKIIIVKQ